MSFNSLGLSGPLLKALEVEGYEHPTPIQLKAIPPLLAGRDTLGIAQTGTGKTAAFALPILQLLADRPVRTSPGKCRALILSPTRELAAQIGESLVAYGRFLKLVTATVYGGMPINRQISTLKRGVDILVATPGRLVDLLDRRAVTLSDVEIFVLDEVDRMLDLGFIHAIRRISGQLPKSRQNLFFSATLPKEIAGLADALLKDPVRMEVTPAATTADRIEQHVIHVDGGTKLRLLTSLLAERQMLRTLVFTRTKRGADKVARGLTAAGIEAGAIHGNKSQPQRERALAGFRNGATRVLVATDIAARGLDIPGVSHVVNYDLPEVAEAYVHRIGRTARAGASGTAIAFCDGEQQPLLRDIERVIGRRLEAMAHSLAGVSNARKGTPHQPRPQAPARRFNPAQGKDRSKPAEAHARDSWMKEVGTRPVAGARKPKRQGRRRGSWRGTKTGGQARQAASGSV